MERRRFLAFLSFGALGALPLATATSKAALDTSAFEAAVKAQVDKAIYRVKASIGEFSSTLEVIRDGEIYGSNIQGGEILVSKDRHGTTIFKFTDDDILLPVSNGSANVL